MTEQETAAIEASLQMKEAILQAVAKEMKAHGPDPQMLPILVSAFTTSIDDLSEMTGGILKLAVTEVFRSQVSQKGPSTKENMETKPDYRWGLALKKRPPDQILGDDSSNGALVHRWWLKERKLGEPNVYLHHLLRSDDDRAFHDHPWDNVSILLKGKYLEHTPEGVRKRVAPCIIRRKAGASHRLELPWGPVWSLFLTGPKIREWGFQCPDRWIHWTQFGRNGCD